jgi:DNA-binding beta-propeller fold protein YncE
MRLRDATGLALLALAGLAIASGGAVPDAAAESSVFWTERTMTEASRAALAGGGYGALSPGGAPEGAGLAIDAAAGRLYWTKSDEDPIAYEEMLDGHRGSLDVEGLSTRPTGLAIDAAAGRIYWATGEAGGEIVSANLDGSGAAELDTGGATVAGPVGLAVDPAGGRIYWANFDADEISFANLDGSGGGDLGTGAAAPVGPAGVAIDHDGGRIYWANHEGNTIAYANLDGSGGALLPTPGLAPLRPSGVALDLEAGRIYWANELGRSLAFARLDGSGGERIVPAGPATVQPGSPAIFQEPRPASPPTVGGEAAVGATLTCDEGGWEADSPGAFMFQAPENFATAWTRDGEAIPGATGSSLTVEEAGSYACTVSASNAAGTAAQPSAAVDVPPFEPPVSAVSSGSSAEPSESPTN